MKKTFVAALLAATCALSTSAIAAPIAMDGSFGTGNMTSGAYNAVFSGKSFLPEQYTVNSLSFSFTFLDDGSDNYTKSVATGKTKTVKVRLDAAILRRVKDAGTLKVLAVVRVKDGAGNAETVRKKITLVWDVSQRS